MHTLQWPLLLNLLMAVPVMMIVITNSCCKVEVAHYVIDAVLFSIPLLRSSNWYFLTSGVIVILLAGLPAVLSLVMREKTT